MGNIFNIDRSPSCNSPLIQNEYASTQKDVRDLLYNRNDELVDLHQKMKGNPNAHMGTNTFKLKNIPYYAKYGIERYYNTQRLKKVIKLNNLNLLNIPNCYIYTFDNESITNNNSIVICQEIIGIIGKDFELNCDQIKQLYTFVIKAQYYHMHRLNYIIDHKGIINIIDVGYPEVIHKDEAIQLREHYIKNGNGIHIGNSQIMDPFINDPVTQFELCTYSKYSFVSNDAYAWLHKKFKERENERLKLKLLFNKGEKTIHELLEFDTYLYE